MRNGKIIKINWGEIYGWSLVWVRIRQRLTLDGGVEDPEAAPVEVVVERREVVHIQHHRVRPFPLRPRPRPRRPRAAAGDRPAHLPYPIPSPPSRQAQPHPAAAAAAAIRDGIEGGGDADLRSSEEEEDDEEAACERGGCGFGFGKKWVFFFLGRGHEVGRLLSGGVQGRAGPGCSVERRTVVCTRVVGDRGGHVGSVVVLLSAERPWALGLTFGPYLCLCLGTMGRLGQGSKI